VKTPPDSRPVLTAPLERLLADVIERTPELAGLRADDILLLAQGAHGRAAASVRPLTNLTRRVLVDDKERRVEIVLRPPFFLDGDASARLTTLVHELLHLDPAHPGQLLEEFRHDARPHAAHEAHAREVAARWLEDADLALLAPLGHDGEVWMRAWKHRPVPESEQQHYTDDDVMLTPVRIVTPRARRTTWW
jgi:hypothetical protein